LKSIASKTKGKFFNAANKEQFESVMKEIDLLEKPVAKLERHKQSQALFLWPLIMAVLVLISERLLSRLRYFNFT